MIIRVFRSRVKPGMHEEYERLLRDTAIPLMLAAPGLVKLHVGTPLDDPPQEFLLMSVWKDIGSLRAFMGRRWRESVVVPGEAHLVAEAIVDHYEVLEMDDPMPVPGTSPVGSLAE
ncbi:MAG: antibiotic biosynthesis monooxygenase [Chloroflexota bacterium]|nr:antibiotic biosynthesis monooxygenase [Chloroflexota bacterium]MDP9370827.1 antibiotic biosynthesis monooxygenase [Chloroflexota bacterium]